MPEELNALSLGCAPVAFCDVACDGNGGPPKLIRETEISRNWEKRR
jgi:hypothetical protein